VSEDSNSLYTQSFTGGCDASGTIALVASTSNICTIVNTVIPPIPSPPNVSVGNNNVTIVGTTSTVITISTSTSTNTSAGTSTIAVMATTTSVAVTINAVTSSQPMPWVTSGFPDTGFPGSNPRDTVILLFAFIASFLYLLSAKKSCI
jgi:hypothetical protein